MKNAKYNALLNALLDEQEKNHNEVSFTTKELEDIIYGWVEITDEQRRAILFSPDARGHYNAVRERIYEHVRKSHKNKGFENEFTLMAAFKGSEEDLSFSNKTFTLTAHYFKSEKTWTLTLELNGDYLKDFPKTFKVVLEDSGGLQWVNDYPDAYGMINTVWAHSESPQQRLSQHKLILKP